MIEFNETTLWQTRNETFQLLIKSTHILSNWVLLLQYIFSHIVQRLVVNLENIFDLLLLFAYFTYKSLLFNFVVEFQICESLLDIFSNFTQYDVFLTLVFWEALYAVEVAANLIAVFNLYWGMFCAEELLYVEIERTMALRSFYGAVWLKCSKRCGCSVEVAVFLVVGVNLGLALLINFKRGGHFIS